MTKEQHIEICNKVQDENLKVFSEEIDKVMDSHKKWLEERLGRLESDMKLYVEKMGKLYGKEA